MTTPSIGLAALARMVFEGADIQPLFAQLVERAGEGDVAALMDIATMMLLTGDREGGLRIQAEALQHQRLYRRPPSDGAGPKLLALMAAGDTMANTPLDFLLEGSDIELLTLYVGPDQPLASPLPDYDVAFLAVGESEANRPLLHALEPVARAWPTPLLNGAPARIAELTRDGVCALMDGAKGVLAPATIRLDRDALARVGQGGVSEIAFPFIVRPIGSQAGAGLEKLTGPEQIAPYLESQDAPVFYLAPFIDYSGPDGLFRKQRIALIDGRPFVCHLAISAHWMVHYMNATMIESADNRAEEARFMADFDSGFAERHRAAFESLYHCIGLDYFAIDCAETHDGRLLLFEADVAMIVHAMDPPDLFPYKGPQMRKVFEAFQAMVRKRVR
jgi:hypothetical protein